MKGIDSFKGFGCNKMRFTKRKVEWTMCGVPSVYTVCECRVLYLSSINPDHWYRMQIIRNNQSYHKLVEVCSQKHPFVGSNRVCVSSCTGKEMVVGNRQFCRDNNVNYGFCVINACQVHGFKCYYMECFKRSRCPVFTVSYNN